MLIEDPVKQGEARLERPDRFDVKANAEELDGAITIEEFAGMVEAARAGEPVGVIDRN